MKTPEAHRSDRPPHALADQGIEAGDPPGFGSRQFCRGRGRGQGREVEAEARWSLNAGYGQPLACAALLQPVPISCHFRGCKAPLSSIVSGAVTTELPLPFYLYQRRLPILLTCCVLGPTQHPTPVTRLMWTTGWKEGSFPELGS